MSEEQWTAVDQYINDLLIPREEVLEAAIQSSTAAGLPSIQVSPTEGKFLMILALAQRAQTALEIGTLGGYSTIWLARGLPANGRLTTLELDQKHAEVARANVARAGLANVVDVIVGPALETLPRLAAEKRGPFDLIFIDAAKNEYPQYLKWALTLSRTGSVIVADNVVWRGAVLDASSNDPNIQGIRSFNEMLAAEPRLEATAIQTVGARGHDGFAIAVVT